MKSYNITLLLNRDYMNNTKENTAKSPEKLATVQNAGIIDSLLLMPFKKVALDLLVFFIINTIVIYCVLFFISDTSIAMLGVIWVGIIAWRGGILAGLISCFVIYFSNFIAVNSPPHNLLPIQYYIDNRIPGFLIGLMQCLICGSVVGYISTLVHKLQEEVGLRKKIQVDLEQKIAELDAFGRTIAHDLKNPLMVINLSIASLVKEFASIENTKAKQKLNFINDGTKHMINIIESILVLAGIKKIDQSEIGAFPMSECVDEALRRIAYNIEENGIQIQKPLDWPSVAGYSPWITEVWVNYLTNGIKYGGNPSTNRKPALELGYNIIQKNGKHNSDYVRFWVKDNGEGISREKAATLFKEFTRLHSTEYEGYGLGLSIVKTIVEKSKGEVGVESEEGKGSVFYFTLPAKEN